MSLKATQYISSRDGLCLPANGWYSPHSTAYPGPLPGPWGVLFWFCLYVLPHRLPSRKCRNTHEWCIVTELLELSCFVLLFFLFGGVVCLFTALTIKILFVPLLFSNHFWDWVPSKITIFMIAIIYTIVFTQFCFTHSRRILWLWKPLEEKRE